MNKMEILTLAVKTAKKIIFILFFLVFASCAAQKRPVLEEEKIYSLIEHHFDLNQKGYTGKFLYFETLSIKENLKFHWTKELTLSEFLADPFFKKKCREIQKLLDNNQIKDLNEQFASLESTELDESKFSKTILSENFLQHETYKKAPKAANRKISYPIIIYAENYILGLFIEDAHNEGGNLYFYKLMGNEWKLFCKDSLWLI